MALCVSVLAVWLIGSFGYSSVCKHCGRWRHTQEWQVPILGIPLVWYSSESQSPISRVLAERGLVPPHSHEWLFCHGGGNGICCALGRGHNLASTINSEKVARLIEDVDELGGPAERKRLIELIFDEEHSREATRIAGLLPERRFADQDEFRDWLNQWAKYDENAAKLLGR